MKPSQNTKPSGQKKDADSKNEPGNAPRAPCPPTSTESERNDFNNQTDRTRGVYVPIGGQDLHPLGRSNGGGMLYDPMRAERTRGRGADIDYIGNPQRLPSGSVPPGARFDPFGPPALNQHHNRPPNKQNMQTDPVIKGYYGREPDPNLEPMPDDDDLP